MWPTSRQKGLEPKVTKSTEFLEPSVSSISYGLTYKGQQQLVVLVCVMSRDTKSWRTPFVPHDVRSAVRVGWETLTEHQS